MHSSKGPTFELPYFSTLLHFVPSPLFSLVWCFAAPDAAGIVDKQSVTILQNQMIDCLQHYSTCRYPDERRRPGLILLRLPTLRTISAKAAELFLSLSLEGNVKMNALVLEMMNW